MSIIVSHGFKEPDFPENRKITIRSVRIIRSESVFRIIQKSKNIIQMNPKGNWELSNEKYPILFMGLNMKSLTLPVAFYQSNSSTVSVFP